MVMSQMEKDTYRRRIFALRQPPTRFVIFSRARSGSTLLVDLMNASDRVFCDGELFHDRRTFPSLFLHSRSALSEKPAYGFKLLSYQLSHKLPKSYESSFLSSLVNRHGYRLIYLYRENTLAQEISNVLAHQRKSFQRRGDQAPTGCYVMSTTSHFLTKPTCWTMTVIREHWTM